MQIHQAYVGHLMVGIESADHGNSLAAVSTMLIDYGVPAIPVTRDGLYIGLIFEHDILTSLSQGRELNAPADQVMRQTAAISNRASASEALRAMEAANVSTLAVVDDQSRVLGVITASRLIAANDRYARPKLVGGLATPFGVRLLGGGVTGGANSWQILGTGAIMFLTFLLGSYLALVVSWFVPVDIRVTDWYTAIHYGMGLLFFLLLLRFQPLSGYHAAEHMVVHAIEQSEPLEPETVSRMPRVHPRCGTNVAVAAGLFLSISETPFIPQSDIRFLIALLTTIFLFRPLGALVQREFTTQPPSNKQLEAGIRAGKELLANYQTGSNTQVSIPVRIWQTGMLHAIAGSMGAALVVYQILAVLPIPDYWKVIL